MGLSDAAPEMSARRGITLSQTFVLLSAAGLAVFAFMRAPATSFTIASLVAGVFFIAIMIFRLVLMIASLTRPAERAPPSARQTDPAALPIYSILVALRDEAALLPQITRALSALDYPATKLDIILLLEASDEYARARPAACSRSTDVFACSRFRTGCLAPSRKRAISASALPVGTYVTVYDAEDRPDPEQLLAALAAFDKRPETACMQARLAFYNAAENWLTRQFALEFTQWFALLLPGLARLGLPIPLGGTSNHFRREVLEAAHGWDAFNVTEDADIGIRLARAGGRVRTIASTTLEEANCELANWLHQRSRWLKGYLQTWLVHMRAPSRLARELGVFGFWSFQLLIGGAVLSALLHLAFWAVLIVQIAEMGLAGVSWTGMLLTWTLTVLILGNGLAIACGMVAALHPQLKGQGRLELLLSALSMPLYWFLISFAAIKALISFASRPFYWAKTRHGLSRLAPSFERPDQAGALKRARSGQA